MVNYDTTQIAIFVSLVFTIAAIGTALALGVLVQALMSVWRTRPALPGRSSSPPAGSRSTTELAIGPRL